MTHLPTGVHAEGLVKVLYVDVAGSNAAFVLIDEITGEEHAYEIETGTAIAFDNVRYAHRVGARAGTRRRDVSTSLE